VKNNIEIGWCFDTADFSTVAAGRPNAKGSVSLVRDQEGRRNWHNLTDEQKDSDDCPPLYVEGRGETLDEAFAWANSNARCARTIPRNGSDR
jgi:hypothetical protein